MQYALLGALLMVGGIAAEIEARRHRPIAAYQPDLMSSGPLGPPHPASGWSTTADDLVRIGGWALLIFGAVIVAFALVRELRR